MHGAVSGTEGSESTRPVDILAVCINLPFKCLRRWTVNLLPQCPNKCSGGLKFGGKPTAWTLLSFFWSSSSSQKALSCVWSHQPAVIWILLHKETNLTVQHVSDGWTATSAWSGWSPFRTGVQLQGEQSSHRIYCFHCLFINSSISLSPLCLYMHLSVIASDL